jgi:hypothetical protein
MLKKINVFIAVCIMVFMVFKTTYAEVIDRIVAIVNEDIITFVELNQALRPYFV